MLTIGIDNHDWTETAVSKATRHVQESDVALLDWGQQEITSLSKAAGEFSRPIWRPTASTGPRLPPLLGVRCADDAPCRRSVNDSVCLFGVCSCADGFSADEDQRFCIGQFYFISLKIFFHNEEKMCYI